MYPIIEQYCLVKIMWLSLGPTLPNGFCDWVFQWPKWLESDLCPMQPCAVNRSMCYWMWNTSILCVLAFAGSWFTGSFPPALGFLAWREAFVHTWGSPFLFTSVGCLSWCVSGTHLNGAHTILLLRQKALFLKGLRCVYSCLCSVLFPKAFKAACVTCRCWELRLKHQAHCVILSMVFNVPKPWCSQCEMGHQACCRIVALRIQWFIASVSMLLSLQEALEDDMNELAWCLAQRWWSGNVGSWWPGVETEPELPCLWSGLMLTDNNRLYTACLWARLYTHEPLSLLFNFPMSSEGVGATVTIFQKMETESQRV
jgi:hypothetical protein